MAFQRSQTKKVFNLLLLYFCLNAFINNLVTLSSARQLKNPNVQQEAIGKSERGQVVDQRKNKAKMGLGEMKDLPPLPFPLPPPIPQIPGIPLPPTIPQIPGIPLPPSIPQIPIPQIPQIPGFPLPPSFDIPQVPPLPTFPLPPFPPMNIPRVPSFPTPSPPM